MSVNRDMRGPASSDVETSVTSDTSGDGPSEITVILFKQNPYLTGFVAILCLLLIWGVSLLPLIFYVSPLPSPPNPPPPHNSSNLSIVIPVPPFTCNRPLLLNPKTKMCVPPCSWVFFSPMQDKAQQVVDNISLAISLLGFVIILLTWIAIKQLRVFPHIIPLYIQGLSSIISLLVVIGNGMGREKSFCKTKFSNAAGDDQTHFCTAQGVLIQYFANATGMWFVVYSINLLKMICSNQVIDPRHSTTKQHIISSAACWLLPWIPVAIVLARDKYIPYNMRICAPRDPDLAYFTNSAILELAQGVGCTCLFLVVYKLYQMRDLDILTVEQSKPRRRRLDKIAIRLICLMFVYAVSAALVYIPICVQLRHKLLIKHYITEYFVCLMFAPSSSFCTKTYEQYTFADTWIASYLSSALFTIATVCFLAFNKQSRRLWAQWWRAIVLCCCPPEEDMNELN